jgi:hydroxyquinol 1,2-dioxygenase
VTHVFIVHDDYLGSDVAFGIKDGLIHELVRCPPGRAPDGRAVGSAYLYLNYVFDPKRVANAVGVRNPLAEDTSQVRTTFR